MSAKIKNISVLIPSMDETYSLSQTVDVITQTCMPEDIAEILIIISTQKTSLTIIMIVRDLITKYHDRIITASRWRKGRSFSGYSKIKLIFNYIFEKSIALFYFSTLSDMTFGYRIFPSKLIKSINWKDMQHPFFLETALKLLKLGVKFLEVPAKWKLHQKKTESESVNSFFATFKYFRPAWHNMFVKPEKILADKGDNQNEI